VKNGCSQSLNHLQLFVVFQFCLSILVRKLLPLIHFLLTPDKSASLALKRLVAQQGARMDVVIGTWPELLTLAKSCQQVPSIGRCS
jgi:hypothetical protein